MSIQGQLDRLHGAKAEIAASLAVLGAAVPEGNTLDQYAALLSAQAGGIGALLDTINGEVV